MSGYLSLNTAKPSATMFSTQEQLAPAKIRAKLNSPEAARQAAEDFESVYLNTMLSQMTTATGNDGPFGDGPATGAWRSMLTQEYAKGIAKKGGIGIADHVYRELLARQDIRAQQAPKEIAQ